MIERGSDIVFIYSQTDFPNSALNPVMSYQGSPDHAIQKKETEIQVGDQLYLSDHILLDTKLAATKIQLAWRRYKQQKLEKQSRQQQPQPAPRQQFFGFKRVAHVLPSGRFSYTEPSLDLEVEDRFQLISSANSKLKLSSTRNSRVESQQPLQSQRKNLQKKNSAQNTTRSFY